MAITAGKPGIFPGARHKEEKPQQTLYGPDVARLLRVSINRFENEAERKDLLERFLKIKQVLQKEDVPFIEDLLIGIVVTLYNGVHLSNGSEKEYREWKIPTHDVVRLVRILDSLPEEHRKTLSTLITDSERYAVKLGEDAIQEDIFHYQYMFLEAKTTFKQ
ncbi:MAG: hypothetical protein M1504_03440 [Candidatus Marsarchaeota archaeon]|nr:hypothetical protein [Candidatus Marsarchaeota archaeon]